MYFWSFSSDNAAANLAYDEALLEAIDDATELALISEKQQPPVEVLRLWEMPITTVVLGRSSKAADEAKLDFCQQYHVPILRRCTGGSTILAGMGCLMYSAVLSFQRHPQLAMIDAAHDFVMDRLCHTFDKLSLPVQRHGICDLTHCEKKISGNALRLKRHSVLYHGTILYQFDLSLLPILLGQPARQPEYRGGRSHHEFVGNVPVSPGELMRSLRSSFDATQDWFEFPYRDQVNSLADQLLTSRYSQHSWNYSR